MSKIVISKFTHSLSVKYWRMIVDVLDSDLKQSGGLLRRATQVMDVQDQGVGVTFLTVKLYLHN